MFIIEFEYLANGKVRKKYVTHYDWHGFDLTSQPGDATSFPTIEAAIKVLRDKPGLFALNENYTCFGLKILNKEFL